MNKALMIKQYQEIADIHAQRLSVGLERIASLMPFTEQKCQQLSNEEVAFFDMTTTRFSKLQDVIGSKLFPLTLEYLGEDAQTFIDKLNKLEKLQYLNDADWWMQLREIRNELAHDYPNDYAVLAQHANKFVRAAQELMVFWGSFKDKIEVLLGD